MELQRSIVATFLSKIQWTLVSIPVQSTEPEIGNLKGPLMAGIDRLCSATQAECPSLFMGVRDQLQITRTPLTVEPSRAR